MTRLILEWTSRPTAFRGNHIVSIFDVAQQPFRVSTSHGSTIFVPGVTARAASSDAKMHDDDQVFYVRTISWS